MVVNRGFVPEGRQDPKTRPEAGHRGVIEIVGAMRWPEPRGMFTPSGRAREEPLVRARSRRDGGGEEVGHCRAVLHRSGGAARAGRPPEGRAVEASLPNNHLQYAVTWYGLALVVLISAAFFVRARRREGTVTSH